MFNRINQLKNKRVFKLENNILKIGSKNLNFLVKFEKKNFLKARLWASISIQIGIHLFSPLLKWIPAVQFQRIKFHELFMSKSLNYFPISPSSFFFQKYMCSHPISFSTRNRILRLVKWARVDLVMDGMSFHTGGNDFGKSISKFGKMDVTGHSIQLSKTSRH